MFGQKMFSAHVYMDTMDARVASIHGKRYGQVFATKYYFVNVYPIKNKFIVGMVLVNLSQIMVFLLRLRLMDIQIRPCQVRIL